MGTICCKSNGTSNFGYSYSRFEKWDVIFRANGSQVKFPGFMKVYVEGSDDQTEEKDKLLPELEVGDKVNSLDN